MGKILDKISQQGHKVDFWILPLTLLQVAVNMKSFICIGVLFGLALSVSAQDCPRDWVQYEDRCYYVITNAVNWFEADNYCTFLLPGTYKVHLAAINSPQEQQWLQNYLASEPGYRFRNFWTSGNNLDRRVGWKWSSTGGAVSYTNWAPGEPNASGECMQIWGEVGYQWDDADCYGPINFICEVGAADLQG